MIKKNVKTVFTAPCIYMMHTVLLQIKKTIIISRKILNFCYKIT